MQSGERNDRVRIRQVDKSRWDEEAAIVLAILNDAWSSNLGFVPFTEREIAYAAKKLKPIIHEPLNMIAELDGRPVAFMLVFPDINGVQLTRQLMQERVSSKIILLTAHHDPTQTLYAMRSGAYGYCGKDIGPVEPSPRRRG